MPFQKGHKLNSGKNNPMFGIHRFKEEAPMYKKHHSEKRDKD